MTLGILKEYHPENRVSLLAEAVASLTKKGVRLLVEQGAGERAYCTDADYEKAGATVMGRSEVLAASDLLLSIHQPAAADIMTLEGRNASVVLIGVFQPMYNLASFRISWFRKIFG